MFRRKKNRDEITNIELTEGMMICPEYQGSENRMKTLLLKGVLVYLLVMGVMGSYLSALDIRFSWVALHVVIFLCTMYCAALYYNKLWQDIGYLLLLGAMAVGVVFSENISTVDFIRWQMIFRRQLRSSLTVMRCALTENRSEIVILQ